MEINAVGLIAPIIFIASSIAFPFWPLTLLSNLLQWRGGLTKLTLRLLTTWCFFLVLRIIILFNPNPNPAFLIPEPLNTILFAMTGIVLVLVTMLLKKRMRLM